MIKVIFLALAALKFGKIGVTAGSMMLSLWVYSMLWGWPFAAGFVGLLFAHEMGHVMAARVRGLPVSAPAFIPFMGAIITMKEMPPDAETEAYVAYGGPFIGTLACFAVFFWAQQTGSMLGLAISYSGFFLNLFNLLPVSPLDGGRIAAVLGPRIWLLGAPLLVAAMLYQPSPVLILVAVIAFPQLKAAWRYDPNAPENQRYYGQITPSAKLEYTVLYLALALLLALMAYHVHVLLSGVHGGA